MKPFYIEGVYQPRQTPKKAARPGAAPAGGVEPYAKTIWANSVDEAIRLAKDEMEGVVWVEGPRQGRKSEEKRMQELGAPQLPGFDVPAARSPGGRKK